MPKQKYFFPAFADKVILSGTNNAVNFPPNNSFRLIKTRKHHTYYNDFNVSRSILEQVHNLCVSAQMHFICLSRCMSSYFGMHYMQIL